MNDSTNACPKCGATVSSDAPQGLCPKCVLGAAAAPEAGPTATAQIPSLERLAVAFPQLQILELIGRGGMGFVFKARQPHLDRFVALKLLPDSLAQDAHFAERFNREGRTLARLNHPNIVSIFDFGQAGGFYFLLMEYVDGVNLRQAMQAGRFSTSEALTIVPKICEALQYAHEEGVLHRDIKPENILLDAKGRVKIADFGIAKIVGEEKPDVSLTATGAALGTPHYMAPEQFEKPGTVDHRADIYSLGVVFYEMLTGELPIGRFALPSQKTPVDSRFDDVVLRTLEREREKRFQSAGEMKTNVEHLTDAAPTSPQPPPPVANAGSARGTIAIKPEAVLPETPTWSHKTIWGAVLVAVSLLPIAAGLAILLYFAANQRFTQSGVSASLLPFMVIAFLPAIAGTILGWMGLSDLRAHAGGRRGLPLAVFAALAWPLISLVCIAGIFPILLTFHGASPGSPAIFGRLLAFLVPACTITFAVWSIYATARWGGNKPYAKRRGVLKWIFLGLTLPGVGLIVLAVPNASWLPAIFRAGPRSEVRYRVFEIESAVADRFVPKTQRQTGATGNWQMSDIDTGTLAALLDARVLNKHVMIDRHPVIRSSKSASRSSRTIVSTYKPGLKEPHQQEIIGWTLVSDNWSHTLHNQLLNDKAQVSGHGFFGVRHTDGVLQLKVQHVVTHKIGDRPAVQVNIAYEGKAPQKDAIAFFIPFARKDDTTGYLVFAVEVNSVDTEAEQNQPIQQSLMDNSPPWIGFTFTAVELRNVQGARWLAIDYLDDIHGDCEKSFPWETTIPGFKAETRTSEYLNEDDKSSPPARHQRVEYRIPSSIPTEQLQELRDRVERRLKHKRFRQELNDSQAPLLLFELPGVEGGSLKAWLKVIPNPATSTRNQTLGVVHLVGAVVRENIMAVRIETLPSHPLHEIVLRYSGPDLPDSVLKGPRPINGPYLTPSREEELQTPVREPVPSGDTVGTTEYASASSLKVDGPGDYSFSFVFADNESAQQASEEVLKRLAQPVSLNANGKWPLFHLNDRMAWLELRPYYPSPDKFVFTRRSGRSPAQAASNNIECAVATIPAGSQLKLLGRVMQSSTSKSENLFSVLLTNVSLSPAVYWFTWYSLPKPETMDSSAKEDWQLQIHDVHGKELFRVSAPENLKHGFSRRWIGDAKRTVKEGEPIIQALFEKKSSGGNRVADYVLLEMTMHRQPFAAAEKRERRDHAQKIELSIPTITNDSYNSVGVTTDSELPVGDYLVGLFERPDGRVEEKPAVVNISRGFGRGGTMHHILWTMNQFESNDVRNILGEMRSKLDGRLIELRPGERSPVFRATNNAGAVTEGFIALRSQNSPASDLPPVTVSIAEVPQNWGMFLSVKIRVSAPPGYYPRAVGMLEDGSEAETHTTIMGNGRGNSWSGDLCMWYFPSEFEKSDVQEIVHQLELTKVTAPNGIRIPPGQRVPMFSVTNKAGTIFRGYFELPMASRTK